MYMYIHVYIYIYSVGTQYLEPAESAKCARDKKWKLRYIRPLIDFKTKI